MIPGKAGEWSRRHPLRAAIYALLLVTGLALALGPLLLCAQEERLSRWAQSPRARAFAEGFGIRYSFASLVLRCYEGGCGPALRLGGVELALLGEPALHLQVEEARLCLLQGLRAKGVRSWVAAGTGNSLQFAAAELAVDRRQGSIAARELRLGDAASPLLSLARLTAGPLRFHRRAKELSLEEVSAEAVDARLARLADGRWNFEEVGSLAGAARTLGERVSAGGNRLRALAARWRSFLLLALLALSVGAMALKAWLVPYLRRPLRAALSLVPPGLAFGFYAVTAGRISLGSALAFLVLVGGSGLVLQRVFYRRGPEWQQRWEPFALDLALPPSIGILLLAHGFRLDLPSSLRVDRFEAELRQVSASCGATAEAIELGRLAAPACARARNLRVDLDLATLAVSGLELERASITGIWQSDALIRALGKAEFLSPAPERLFLATDVDVEVSRRIRPPPSVPHASWGAGDVPRATVAAALAVGPRLADFRFKSNILARGPGLALEVAAAGDLEQVRFEKLALASEGKWEIGRGSGALTLTPELSWQLRLEQVRFPAAKLVLDSAEISTALPAPCECTDLRLDARLSHLKTRDPAFELDLERAEIDFERRGGPEQDRLNLRGRLRNLALQAAEGRVEGDLPRAEIELAGRSTKELFPRGIEARLNLRATRSDGENILVLETPVRVSADLWRGRLAVPAQEVRFRQKFVDLVPSELRFRTAATAALESLGPRTVGGARLRLNFPPLAGGGSPFTIGGGELLAEGWLVPGGSEPRIRLRYESRRNTLKLPRPAEGLGLGELSALDFHADGRGWGLPPRADLRAELEAWGNALRALMPRSDSLDFDLEGSWPSAPLLKATAGGRGVEAGTADTELGRLFFRDARLSELSLKSTISGIRVPGQPESVAVDSRLVLSGSALQLATELNSSEGDPALGSEIRIRSGEISLDLWEASLEAIRPLLSPYLESRGFSPHAFQASVPHFSASFSDLEAGKEIRIALAPGARFSVTAPAPSVNFREPRLFETFRMSFGGGAAASNPTFRARVFLPRGPRPHASVDLSASAVELEALEAGGLSQQTRSELSATARIDSAERDAPVSERISSAVLDLLDQGRRGVALWDPGRNGDSGRSQIEWNLRLQNRKKGEPVLERVGEGWRLRLALPTLGVLSREPRSTNESHFSGSLELMADFGIHREHLVVDALLPARLRLGLAGAEPAVIEVTLPFQLAFAPRLREPGFYQDFWPGFLPGLGSVRACLLCRETVIGGVSLRGPVLPTDPIRIALGHGEGLQFQTRLAADALYGHLASSARGELRWLPGEARLSAQGELRLESIQASALGIAAPGEHVEVLEDAIDGEIQMSAEDLPIDARNLYFLSQSPWAARGLEGVAIDVGLRSSPRQAGAPAVLQLSSQTQVGVMNELLNAILPGLRLTVPPRRLCYDRFRFAFSAKDGRATSEPLLQIDRLRVPCGQAAEVEGNIRVHLIEGK